MDKCKCGSLKEPMLCHDIGTPQSSSSGKYYYKCRDCGKETVRAVSIEGAKRAWDGGLFQLNIKFKF